MTDTDMALAQQRQQLAEKLRGALDIATKSKEEAFLEFHKALSPIGEELDDAKKALRELRAISSSDDTVADMVGKSVETCKAEIFEMDQWLRQQHRDWWAARSQPGSG